MQCARGFSTQECQSEYVPRWKVPQDRGHGLSLGLVWGESAALPWLLGAARVATRRALGRRSPPANHTPVAPALNVRLSCLPNLLCKGRREAWEGRSSLAAAAWPIPSASSPRLACAATSLPPSATAPPQKTTFPVRAHREHCFVRLLLPLLANMRPSQTKTISRTASSTCNAPCVPSAALATAPE